MTYSMETIYNATKIRQDPSTHNPITKIPTAELTRVNANVKVTGTEKWTALTDGYEVKAGDVWLKVSYNGVTGWMAYIHKGQPICKNLVETTTPTEPTAPKFPEYFILTDPEGKTQRYNKA